MCRFPFRAGSFVAHGGHLSSAWRRARAAFTRGGRAKPMANRPAHRSRPVVELRRTIDCLPLATREAMLAGVRAGERIIVGAYVDARGGVCPMLAAHRRGG